MFSYPLTHITGNILTLGNQNILQDILHVSPGSTSCENVVTQKFDAVKIDVFEDTMQLNSISCRIAQQYIQLNSLKDSAASMGDVDSILDEIGCLIMKPDIILFPYDLANLDTFRSLEFWIKKACLLADHHTEFLLLGISAEDGSNRMVDDDLVMNGVNFIEQEVSSKVFGWSSSCNHLELSSLSSVNKQVFRNLISRSILHGQGILFVEGLAIPISLSQTHAFIE